MTKGYEALLKEYEKNIKEDIKKRTQFIQDQVEKAGMNGVVVGISGGIDSSVSAALAIKALGRSKVLGVWMPAYSDPVHEKDAREMAQAIDLNLITVNLNETTDALVKALKNGLQAGGLLADGNELGTLIKGNTKARERMAVLYATAGQLSYLVMGTCNRTEIHLGYETKGGDQLCDFNPIASMVKAQVRIMARELGIPESILKKAPSADLWAGQTDEGEMGFSYEDADRALLTGEGNPEVLRKMERLNRSSEHKRILSPTI